jgi:hypothetical protein
MKPIFVRLFAALLCLLLLPSFALAQPDPQSPSDETQPDAADTAEANSLASLERKAQQFFDDNQPVRALEVYQYLENSFAEDGWDHLQPDLLYNQAIACYRAGKTGSAIGYLKQLDLLQPSDEISAQIHELQMLIEHNVYRKAPGTMFVRGESNEYATWKLLQQFPMSSLHLGILIAWPCLFVLIGFIILKRRNKRLRLVLGTTIVLTSLILGLLGFMVFQKHRIESLQFGVLTGTDSLRTAPVNGPHVDDKSFVPGITVRIVSSTGDWLQIERFDGIRAWLSSNDLYKLHTQEDLRHTADQH